MFQKLKGLLTSKPHPRKQFDMSDAEFLIAVLESVPEGSKIEFDRSEPEAWVHQLRPWSFRQDSTQFEADFYMVDLALVAEMRKLLGENERALDHIHHLSVISPTGVGLLSSLDNFHLVDLDETLEDKLKMNAAAGFAPDSEQS